MARISERDVRVIEGRQGLLVPEFKPRFEIADRLDLTLYMRLLFTSNGCDVEGNRYQPLHAFSHELVLAADDTRPLTVLRANHVPVHPFEVAVQKEGIVRQQQEYGGYTVEHGIEAYDILVPPVSPGPFERFLSVNNSISSSGGSLGYVALHHSDPSVIWQEEPLVEANYWTDKEWGNSMDENRRIEERRAAEFAVGIEGIMQTTIEFLK